MNTFSYVAQKKKQQTTNIRKRNTKRNNVCDVMVEQMAAKNKNDEEL